MAINIAALAAEHVKNSIEVKLSTGETHLMRGLLTLGTDEQERCVDALERIYAFNEKQERELTKRPTDRRKKATASEEKEGIKAMREMIALRRDCETIIRAAAETPADAEAILADPALRDVEIQIGVVGLWGEETGAGEA